MKKTALVIASLTLLVTAGCSAPTPPTDAHIIDPLPTNTLVLPVDDNAPLYYSADEITRLSNCAARARQAEVLAQEKINGKSIDEVKAAHAQDATFADSPALIDQVFGATFFSKNDFAMKVFNSCTRENNIADDRANRAAFCMTGQFFAEYIWKAKQQGSSEKDVRRQLADSANKAVPLITREIYKHDAESLDSARSRLWNDCIHNFKQR